MRLYFLSTLLLLCTCSIFSQKNGILIKNSKTSETILIEDGKRIRLKTNQGKKISGKLQILDNETILLNNTKILIDDISKIKRNPFGLTIPSRVASAAIGSFTFIVTIAGVVVGSLLGEEDSELFLLFAIPTAALVYNMYRPLNPLKGYKAENNWKYQIQLNHPALKCRGFIQRTKVLTPCYSNINTSSSVSFDLR